MYSGVLVFVSMLAVVFSQDISSKNFTFYVGQEVLSHDDTGTVPTQVSYYFRGPTNTSTILILTYIQGVPLIIEPSYQDRVTYESAEDGTISKLVFFSPQQSDAGYYRISAELGGTFYDGYNSMLQENKTESELIQNEVEISLDGTNYEMCNELEEEVTTGMKTLSVDIGYAPPANITLTFGDGTIFCKLAYSCSVPGNLMERGTVAIGVQFIETSPTDEPLEPMCTFTFTEPESTTTSGSQGSRLLTDWVWIIISLAILADAVSPL